MQIIALGASYFFAVTALDTTTNVGTIDDLTSTARIVLVLPVAILDAVFILWVFTSLSKTLAQLQARRAGVKLDLYRWAAPLHSGQHEESCAGIWLRSADTCQACQQECGLQLMVINAHVRALGKVLIRVNFSLSAEASGVRLRAGFWEAF